MNNSMQSSQAANAGSTSESDPPLRTKELATGLFEFHAEDNTTSQSKREAEATTYMSGFKLVVVLVALCLANFLVALDTTILSTAIPVISDEFHSLPDVGWYVSAYFLTNCAFQLLNGKLYTLFDFKIVFVGAMIVFEIGSLLCAVAPNSEVFILGRAIAGLGSAGIFSGALIAIIHAVQPEKRAGYSGMVVGMYGIASVAGPLIGGAFTSNVTWRWCFYINLPAGGVSIAGVLFLFPHTKAATNLLTADEPTNLRGRIAKFDPVGSVFLLASVTCLLLALQLGGTSYAFSNGRIIALFVIFGILFIGFIVLQFLGGKNATVPPGVLKQRSVLSSTFYMFCVGGHFFILVYFLPIWFQGVRGLSALDSGIRTLPILLAQTFCVVLGGVIVSVTGYYVPLMWASVVLASLGTGLLTTLQVDSGAGMWIGYQILYGIGGGIGYQQGITAAQTVLGPSEAAIGTALMVFVQNLGGTVFVSAASNLFNTKLVQNVEEVVPRLTREQILASGATAFREELTNDEYPLVLGAYNSAIVLTFRMALIMACLCSIGAAGVEWKRASTKESREAIEEHSKGGQTDESRNKTTRIITLPDSRLSGS